MIRNERKLISMVIPCFNEEEVVPDLLLRLRKLCDGIGYQSEVVFVDDGSSDRTVELIRAACMSDPRLKLIELSRNFGHQIAISAGIDYATGDAVVIMDADLQDPPEVVHEMISQWEQGFEIVYGVRRSRTGESWFKRFTAGMYYRLLKSMVPIKIPLDAGDFRLVDRRAVNAFKQLRERSRFVRGLFSWIGFRQVGVEFERPARLAGETKYPISKMLKVGKAINRISSTIHPAPIWRMMGRF
jgi:dolichol-phosphate mannosyltransferase